MSPPPTTAHHLRPGILLLCESYSCACRTGTLMVFWKVGIDSIESTLFLCTFADFTFLGKEEEAFARAKRVFLRRKDWPDSGRHGRLRFFFPSLILYQKTSYS